ncbi:hydantoinase B/oxoprolinase family protein [Bradyrhizobium sp. dw_78]|uniref:hydantoinase B/oxoprolinase family protein n=1 Tax=Bradyrhizobium sp. dw_78 TaxID=2719793 RepID=UPI001BD4D880|nr:hydantoinase B/oxoprolinase family protein [Bradyrhizobium sp. dw_78]
MIPQSKSIIDRDPVTFEVVRSALYAICAEMKSVVMRTSFSPLLSLSADLSCALLDAHGKVVAQGRDIPVHLGAAPFTVRAAFDAFPIENWKAGDGVILNDPYSGGTHLPDVSLIMPIFHEDRLCGFSLSRVHWPDVGGIAAGSSSVSDEIFKEGIRIPPLLIIEGHEPRADILALILANVRVPQDRHGDFRAQIAGAHRAELRVRELARRYGADLLSEVMADAQTYSQRIVRRRLESLPDAVVEHEEMLDGDGIDPDARPLIRARIEKKGDSFMVDFTGSSPCVKGPVNSPLAVTASSVYYTLLALAGGEIPPNNGVYEVAQIVAPEGAIVNAAYPSPVVAANTETSNRIVDILLAALAKAYPDRVPAGSYGSACVYTLGGVDPRTSRRFVHYETVGGGAGATAAGPGAGGIRVHMGNTMNLPIEAAEAAMPIRFTAYQLVTESGGTGLHRGGAGVRKAIEVLVDGVEASILGERTLSAAKGVAGGGAGAVAKFSYLGADGKVRPLPAKSGPHKLSKGDQLEMITAGGGAWGRSSNDAE